MKTWNAPELKELAINATAGGMTINDTFDGKVVYDHQLKLWWKSYGEDGNYSRS